MKKLLPLLLLMSPIAYGQLSIDQAKLLITKYKTGSYSYHESFIGYKEYGAPVILTDDGGASIFGDWADEKGSCALLVKADKNGKEQWKKIIRPQFDELESQSVVQDKNGNFYVFMLSFDRERYRGGTQRIVCLNKTGAILWDKNIGTYHVENNPIVSYIHALPDGRIELRGHIVTEKPEEDKDPIYRYWEGWIDAKGTLTQKTGDVIDWSNQDWQKKLKPE